MVRIGIHMSYLSVCISAEVYRQVRVLLVRRGVVCRVCRVEGVSPYVGIRMGGIGWNYGGPLIGSKTTKKRLKVKQSRQTRLYLGFIGPKTGTMRFGPMAGLV